MVILFDGVCNLCNGFVRFVLKRDKSKIFQFASLQSEYGMGLSAHFNLPTAEFETVVLYDGKRILAESDAVIKIIWSLGGIWKSIIVCYLAPRFIRNGLYNFIAKKRYNLFGKRGQCMIPGNDVKDRFLDSTVFIR
ncbi:MAG: thiol-disulfide oxidoreductase DCC family protein [Bacteroidia bacterium]